ncbi:hypothetical protein CALVIDRAFT_527304 [Calocera viscosa TUFC12733]|uniref:Uncharacterized protein n=1 Tax=Calocera viscosa (strain TUFC12733) TaxID=1330018 RepID=A0A167MDL4_CALVF|nr:hypothetical protein CALVIDRAFT_527304 [Calocera viscosa TUFC12733]
MLSAPSARRSSTFPLSLPLPRPYPPPPATRPTLTRHLSKRKWQHRDAQSLPPTSAPGSEYEYDPSQELEEDLPRLVREHARVGELDRETRKLKRESLELKRTMSEWGAEAEGAEAPMQTNEHRQSTSVRSLLRRKPARQQLAEQEHARAHGMHKSAVASGERALQDAFLSGRMTLDQYEHAVEYLHESNRLPPSPQNPRKPQPSEKHIQAEPDPPAATSFHVARRPGSRAPSPSSSSISLSSAELPPPAVRPSSPLTMSHFPPHPPVRAQNSSGTILPYGCAADDADRGRRGRGRFYVANPSSSPSPSSSEEDLPGRR